MDESLTKVALTSDIPLGKMRLFRIEDKNILISNLDGKFYAIDGKCTHMGGDLSKGNLEGNVVTCPRHHSKFDVTTGKVISHPKMPLFHPKIKDEKTYQLLIQNENIMIKL
jgi:3-phenylpropionate/trans-cinnamate dioxygenase ferredoxin component